MTRRRRALFICGSLNQTTQLHAVARELHDVDAFFSPFYGDRVVDWMRRRGLTETSIAGNRRRGWCLEYLRAHGLPVDSHGSRGDYSLVVMCTDVIVPKNVRRCRTVVVQEGILDPDGLQAAIVRRLRFLPRWAAGTALTGESFLYDRFCVASDAYRENFVARGADPVKVVVTGIPNFDDCKQFADNQFPYRHFVLVCTSDSRETLRFDSRRRLIERALTLAAGRRLIFKLHPNENAARATREIKALAPDALVYDGGSAEEMIANCDVLLTQWSSTAFIGLALGKEVYSNFDVATLRKLAPIQNGGTSASRIARVCRELLGNDEGPVPRAVPRTSRATGATPP